MDEILSKAKSTLLEAVEHDKRGQNDMAVERYICGVECLFEYLSNETEKSSLRSKISNYMARAESLKSRQRIEVRFLHQIEIQEDFKGHSYFSIFEKCLEIKNVSKRLTSVEVEDPFIIKHHQILNFVAFCEISNQDAFNELTESLKQYGVSLTISYKEFHDRIIRFDNGWIVKMGRGLDIYKFGGKYSIGSQSSELRRCKRLLFTFFKKQTPLPPWRDRRRLRRLASLLHIVKLLLNEAENIVLDKFPRKVVEFNNLLNSDKF
uniref:MIT domain-containing protein n=1 Tax=Ditylenchus dipsaci TaxID=166011 RepID=A0A915E1W6_9BILA